MLYNTPSVICQHCEMAFWTNSPFEESLFQVLPVTRDTHVKNLTLCYSNRVVGLSVCLFYIDEALCSLVGVWGFLFVLAELFLIFLQFCHHRQEGFFRTLV